MRVLVVDDSALVRTRLVEMLADIQGVEHVDSAAGFAEASVFVHTQPIDVAVLDVRMPDGSGIDLLRAIRAGGRSTLVIMLTNYPLPQLRTTCLSAGADFFFDKSADFQRVADIVQGVTV